MKRTFFWVLVLEGLVGLHRTVQLQLLQRYWLGLGLDYCDVEWFVLETNRDHSVIFEIASKYMDWRRKWQPTPVFLPGESQGWGSLVGFRLWGHTGSDTTEAT